MSQVLNLVPSTQETVPEEFLRFYKKPLQVEVDVGSLSIDKKKKYGQIRKYQQTRVDEVMRSLMANAPRGAPDRDCMAITRYVTRAHRCCFMFIL